MECIQYCTCCSLLVLSEAVSPVVMLMSFGMVWRLRLMNWLMRGFQAGSGWSLRSRTTISSAIVLLSEAV